MGILVRAPGKHTVQLPERASARLSLTVKYNSKRVAITTGIADPLVRRRVETHLTLLEPLDTAIRILWSSSPAPGYDGWVFNPSAACRTFESDSPLAPTSTR